MGGSSYFLHIDRIKHDPGLIEEEKCRLDGVISKISSEIKSSYHATNSAWLDMGARLAGNRTSRQHGPASSRDTDFGFWWACKVSPRAGCLCAI